MRRSYSVALTVTFAILSIFVGSAEPLLSQEGTSRDIWADYRFLIGEWVNGNPEVEGVGSCSFSLDLQGTIMVRNNHAETLATDERPATIHDDLMVMYWSEGGKLKANYYDNEGHFINYTASFSDDKDTLRFVSEPAPEAPQFRLTYVKGEAGKLNGIFEIAPPGKPGSFSPYLTWTMHRK